MNPDRVTVHVGEQAVTLKIKGVSALRVASILGRTRLDDGRERIWLDRLLHDGGPVTLGNGVALSGAISTIVTLPSSRP